MKDKFRRCRNCGKKYLLPCYWSGCCSPQCLKERRTFLQTKPIDKGKRGEFDVTSDRWLRLRYEVIKKYGRTCLACGAKAPEVKIQVDHIKPRSKFPELTWDINNLQILCMECNRGKLDLDDTDFRPKDEEPDFLTDAAQIGLDR